MNGRSSLLHLGQSVVSATLLLSSLALSASVANASPRLVPVSSDVAKVLSSSKRVSQLSSVQTVSVDVILPSRDQAGLDAYAKAVSNPKSPLFQKYLTAADFASRFGANPADYSAVNKWAQSAGLKVTQRTTSGFLVALRGSAAQIQSAFGVKLYNYTDATGKLYFSASAAAELPSDIASRVKTIVGLSNYARLKPLFKVLTPEQRKIAAALKSSPSKSGVAPDFGSGTGHAGGLTAADLNTAYDMPGAGFQGRGQVLAVYEQGGYFSSDVQQYRTYNNIHGVTVYNRLVNGSSGSVTDLDVSAEAVLDIDMVLAIAPDTKELRVYEDDDNFAPSLLNALGAVADDDIASVLSISYGLDEDIQGIDAITAEYTAFEELAIEGTTVFASAGDDGAYGDEGAFSYPAILNASDPASQPLVTGVGGTELYTNPYTQGYLGEVTWNELGLGNGATGGGVSAVWAIPDYQLDIDGNSVAVENGGSATARNVPDIAAEGDPLTGVDIYATAYSGWTPIGGTSAAAPIWAALAGVVNGARSQAGLPWMGFVNPQLYALGQNPYATLDFHDVLDGSNGNENLFGTAGYFAGFGYDNVTGWGSFDGTQIIPDLGSTPTANVNPPAVPKGFKGVAYGKSGIKLTWNADKSAKGFYVYAVDSSDDLDVIGTTTTDGFTVSGLQSGGLYEFYLGAVNLGGQTYVDEPIFVTAP